MLCLSGTYYFITLPSLNLLTYYFKLKIYLNNMYVRFLRYYQHITFFKSTVLLYLDLFRVNFGCQLHKDNIIMLTYF